MPDANHLYLFTVGVIRTPSTGVHWSSVCVRIKDLETLRHVRRVTSTVNCSGNNCDATVQSSPSITRSSAVILNVYYLL